MTEAELARKPRIHVAGGFYHVILRGNARQDIFDSARDRCLWEFLIESSLERYGHRIHAYCWMSNHVHVAIQAGANPLARFMSFLASNYARKTNLRKHRSGHLFERRYRAILVQEENYLLELIRYIHLNPVRAGMVATPADYRWSSHHAYRGAPAPIWLTVDYVLGLFSSRELRARRQYASFMDAPPSDTVVRQLRTGGNGDGRFLGNDDWLRRLPCDLREPVRMSLDQLVRDTCATHGIAEDELAGASRSRHLARIRAEIALLAIDKGIATISAVARRFGRAQPTLSRAMQNLRNRNKL